MRREGRQKGGGGGGAEIAVDVTDVPFFRDCWVWSLPKSLTALVSSLCCLLFGPLVVYNRMGESDS